MTLHGTWFTQFPGFHMNVPIVPVVSKNVHTIGTIIWKRYPDDRKQPGRPRPGIVNRTFENRTQSVDWVRQSNEIEHHTFSEFDFRTNRIQSNSIELNPSDCVRLSSVSELNRTQSDALSSIEFDLFENRTHWKCGVRFRSIAELNRTQSTDWVRLSSIFERSIYYAG